MITHLIKLIKNKIRSFFFRTSVNYLYLDAFRASQLHLLGCSTNQLKNFFVQVRLNICNAYALYSLNCLVRVLFKRELGPFKRGILQVNFFLRARILHAVFPHAEPKISKSTVALLKCLKIERAFSHIMGFLMLSKKKETSMKTTLKKKIISTFEKRFSNARGVKNNVSFNRTPVSLGSLIKNFLNSISLSILKAISYGSNTFSIIRTFIKAKVTLVTTQIKQYQSVLYSATPVALLQQVAAMAQQGYSITAMHSEGIAYEAIYDGLDYALQNDFITEVVYCTLQDKFNYTVIVYTILIVGGIGALGVGIYYLYKRLRPPVDSSGSKMPYNNGSKNVSSSTHSKFITHLFVFCSKRQLLLIGFSAVITMGSSHYLIFS